LKTSAKPQAAKPQPPGLLNKMSVSGTPVKLDYNEARELAELPAKIEILEQEQGDIARKLCSSTIYSDCPDEARTLQGRFAILEQELMKYLTRWEELEAKRSMGRQKI
ncbi:MAG: ABC transporter ATP-binding protein, partial [Nitrosospira sp.]